MSRVSDRPIDPPEPSIDELIRQDFERTWCEARKDELVTQAMKGQGEFWSQAHSEHAEQAFGHIRRLITQRHLSDAMRWQALETTLRGLAGEWATWMTEE